MTTTTAPAPVTIKTTTLQEITVNHEGEWARLLLEHHTGRVVIVSGYGEWSYRWTAIGTKTLSQFLSGLDSHYMGEKLLGAGLRVGSDQSTIQAIREEILQYRRDGSLTKDEAAEEWENVKRYELGWGDFRWWCDETSFDCPYEYRRDEVVARWISFWERVWVPFLKPALESLK